METKEILADTNNNLEYSNIEVQDDENDEDFIPVIKAKKTSEIVTLNVSRKRLAKETSITAKRHKIGIVAQRDFLANVINVGGGDIKEFSLSNKTVRTAGTDSVKEAAEQIKKDFKKIVEEDLGGKKVHIIHIDGKSLAQFHDQSKSIKKRLSVILSSPDLSSNQVLGIPIIREWNISPYIMGIGFDTTSDNTGRKNGSVVLIEKEIGEAIWWVACPHHYYEIHVKKVARLHFGDTSSPEETVYKKLRDKWNNILDTTINYDDLDLFDWNKWRGTFVETQARQVLAQLLSLQENNTFPREDMKELLTLVLVWLGVRKEQFRFQYPGAVSHARFLMQSIYSMKIYLLSKQLGDVFTDQEIEQIKNVAIFVGLFHASWYFSCSLASHAPILHLHTISQMKRVEKHMPEVARTVLKSILLHLWYITPQGIPLALTDESLGIDQRSKIAVKLCRTPRPVVFPLGKPTFPDLSAFSNRSWLSGKLPDLSSMMGEESWLLFSKLGMTEEDMKWLKHNPDTWDDYEGYRRFKKFVRSLTITNDPAERGVGLVKDYIATFQNENSCQNNLLAVSRHRQLV